ncbi:MAG: DUF3152 domain-containing protein [Acidimicrobiia bacterium]
MRVVIVLVALVTVGAVHSVFDSSADEFGPGAWARLGAVAAASETSPDEASPGLAMDEVDSGAVDTAPTTPTSTAPAPSSTAPPPSTDTSSTSSTTPSTTVPTGDPARGCAIPGPHAPTGRLANVEVGVPEPSGDAIAVEIELEGGLAVDGHCVADLVISTLSDERGWGGDGRSFEMVDEGARITVTLASPETVDRLCAPLETAGFASCWNGSRAMLNLDRWQTGTDEITDTDLYRTYLINHQVGRALGYDVRECRAEGEPAPVMAGQTFGLDGCTANPWPLDWER